MSNGATIHGKRKFIASLIVACSVLACNVLLSALGKVNDESYRHGLTVTGAVVSLYFGANAAQKFAKGEGND